MNNFYKCAGRRDDRDLTGSEREGGVTQHASRQDASNIIKEKLF